MLRLVLGAALKQSNLVLSLQLEVHILITMPSSHSEHPCRKFDKMCQVRLGTVDPRFSDTKFSDNP